MSITKGSLVRCGVRVGWCLGVFGDLRCGWRYLGVSSGFRRVCFWWHLGCLRSTEIPGLGVPGSTDADNLFSPTSFSPQEPRGLSAASPPLAETGAPRRFRRSVPRGEAAGAVQELARALAHLLEAERQERARAEAQEAEDQQARVLAQMLRVWGAPRNSDPTLGLDDDPDAPAAQLARALLRARLDPAALAAQLVPAPVPAAALRSRPPVYDDGPAGPDAEDAGDETPDVDPELLRYLLGRILAGSADSEGVAAPRRFRRADACTPPLATLSTARIPSTVGPRSAPAIPPPALLPTSTFRATFPGQPAFPPGNPYPRPHNKHDLKQLCACLCLWQFLGAGDARCRGGPLTKGEEPLSWVLHFRTITCSVYDSPRGG
uniref:Proprotein convertase subtilisin/kexin type 1 inhibitor n=1 Tax=Callithrix jacchus TaxID=9483 RepID=A0A2R8M295_CALJA